MARKKSKGQPKAAAPVASGRRTVSACLIVKNEERNLERCLASLLGAVDEIVVVDTGSTDRTVEIAKKLGARVEAFTWVDDFSAARNAALDLAKGDWVLSIDADEWLAHDDSRRFVVAAAQRGGNVAYVPYVRLPEQRGYWGNVRLFPRVGSRWEYRIHEQVVLPRKDTMGIFNDEFLFRHDGYSGPPELRAAKDARNERLLELQLQESEPGSRPWKHATIYLGRARPRPFDAEGEAVVEKGLMESIGFDETGTQLLTFRLYRHWIEAGRFEEIERVNDVLWRAGSRGPMVHFARAVRFFEEGKLDRARAAYEESLAADDIVFARMGLQTLFADFARMLASAGDPERTEARGPNAG